LYTIVDGTIYFDRERDAQMQNWVAAERARIIKKMMSEKKSGAKVEPAQPSYQLMHTCSEHYHDHGLLTIDVDDTSTN